MMLLIVSCTKNETTFTHHAKSKTNIQFNNIIKPTDNINILDFHYLYNGGGVGIADFNNDALPDILFGGNQVSSVLYINQGNFKFEKSDAINTTDWINGISIIDINNDGLKDIYLSVGGHNCDEGNCKNLFYINTSTKNKIEFIEQAEAFGLATDFYSQQAVFFDADKDGDLDCYQLQNHVDRANKNYPKPKRYFSTKSYDKFYLNQQVETGKLFFKDASEIWNVKNPGFGLGVVLTDVNNDGFLEVYVANDFISDDLIYINKEGKSFKESSKQLLAHTSYNSMGVDAADLNNDGYEEIMVVDMLPYTNGRQKTMLGTMNYDKYIISLKENFNSQYIRNTLQKHNQINHKNEALPFTEIGAFSNIYQTDWSWAPLFADYNNDGKTDLYITNGYASNITDLDFVNYNSQTNPFGGKAAAKKEILQNIRKQGEVKLNNGYFENEGDFKFVNRTKTNFADQPSLSNGAAYADLDLDGDLDLVVNNINQTAFIIENKSEGNYIKIEIEGDDFNKDGIGTKVSIWSAGKMQQKLLSPVRGYLSSVEPILHFGLDYATTVDSLIIEWHNGSITQKENIKTNQQLQYDIKDAEPNSSKATSKLQQKLFILKDTLVKRTTNNQPHDFAIQPLLIKQYSNKGFQIVQSLLSEKNKWVFVGSPKGEKSVIYEYSKVGGDLLEKQILNDTNKSVFDATFLDYDGDGDEDLFIAYGGYNQAIENSSYQNKIYINEDGAFVMEVTSFLQTTKRFSLERGEVHAAQNNPMEPVPLSNSEIKHANFLKSKASSCIAANDYDKDGDIDIFVGSQVVPKNYPEIPASVFWQNNDGQLVDKTKTILGKAKLGLIQDAIWVDLNGDDWQDLMIVGEWMAPLVFINKKGQLKPLENNTINDLKGLWRCVFAVDIDKDGDQDIVLGNFGTNSRLQASKKQPLQLVVGDLDENGKHDPLMCFYVADEEGELKAYPYHTRDDIASQLPIIKSKYTNYSDYSKATFDEVLNHFNESNYELKAVNILESIVLENRGNLEFKVHTLPNELQWSTVNVISEGFGDDDNVQLFFGMNDNSLDTHTGKLDGQAVFLLSIKNDFSFNIINNINIGSNKTVSSLMQVGDQIFVGDEDKVSVYETIKEK